MACHPERWRSEEGGHEFLTSADSLAEFTLARLCARSYSSAYGPFPEKLKKGTPQQIKYDKECQKNNGRTSYSDEYALQVIMVREPESILFNMMFSLLVIDCLICTAHGVAIQDLADRLSINLTLLLTAMAFKFILGDTLPPTPCKLTNELKNIDPSY
jgi:hypothetical protein